jgi:hypothetical protein
LPPKTQQSNGSRVRPGHTAAANLPLLQLLAAAVAAATVTMRCDWRSLEGDSAAKAIGAELIGRTMKRLFCGEKAIWLFPQNVQKKLQVKLFYF